MNRGFWLLAALLALAAFWVRLDDFQDIVQPGAVQLRDNDTLRWLAHLQAEDQSPQHPLREAWDGFPDGSELHWTRPMGWVLRALTPLCQPFLPQARGYEAGAALAGPLLSVLALLLLVALLRPLLGDLLSLAAGAFYTLQNPISTVSWLGNGDHQTLQHLLLLLGFLWWLRRRQGVGGGWQAAAAGAALGGAVWVSTESMLLVQLLMATSALELLVWRERTPTRLADERARAAALVATLLLAQCLEQGSLWAVTWDKVSWFTSHQALVFLLFVVLAGRLHAAAALAVALAAGVAALLAIPGYLELVRAELARFAEVNLWLQSCVEEYQSAWSYQGAFSWRAAVKRFTWLLPLLPVLAAACAWETRLRRDARSLLVMLTAGTFALAAWENKLAHLFGMVAPLVVFLGLRRLTLRLPAWSLPPVHGGAALLATALAWQTLPDAPTGVGQAVANATQELCRELAQRGGGRGDAAVLAPWDLGAPLLYAGRVPVVASGYHRNLAGIRDAFQAWLLPPGPELDALLRHRRVHWLAVWFDRRFLTAAARVLGTERRYLNETGTRVEPTDAGRQSLYWRLRFPTAPVPGFRLVYQSTLQITLRDLAPMPLFLLYEWSGR